VLRQLLGRWAIEGGIRLGAKVLLAQPGCEPAAVLLALGEAIGILHKTAGWVPAFSPPS
jgi:hypothetical protein